MTVHDHWNAQSTPKSGAEFRQRWQTHAVREEAVVCLFGPYDSGKSSLLKRLLVDYGQPVPDWLTISGRRETFEAQEVAIVDVAVRDTPGIASGNAQHDQTALEALLLSDVIALVLPPQLLTSDRDAILSIASGRRFCCPAGAGYAPGSLLIALSRMDEAGVVAEDDPDGYSALVQRKLTELSAVLASATVPSSVFAVHAVAADPFGLVGNSPSPRRVDFDRYRHWDGIDAFAATLTALPARLPELRLHAELRFLTSAVGELASSFEEIEAELLRATEAVEVEAASHGTAQERLRAILDAAKADLDRTIEEEIAAVKRRNFADAQTIRSNLVGNLELALERWSKTYDAELARLLAEADADMEVRRSRPTWRQMFNLVDAPTVRSRPDEAEIDLKAALGKAEKPSKLLHKAFRETQAAFTGMSLEKTRAELRRLRDAGSFTAYVEETRKGAERFATAQHAEWAQRVVQVDAVLDTAIPIIFEFGSLIADFVGEERAAQRRAARRAEIHHVLEETAHALAKRAWAAWREEDMAAALEAAISRARESAELAAFELRTERERNGAQAADLRSLLDELGRMV